MACSANKAQIGHLLGAAGAAELAITCLAIRDGFVPPTLNLDDPDPACDLDGTPHRGRSRAIRAALKLSIGFGGHLAAAVLRRPEGLRREPRRSAMNDPLAWIDEESAGWARRGSGAATRRLTARLITAGGSAGNSHLVNFGTNDYLGLSARPPRHRGRRPGPPRSKSWGRRGASPLVTGWSEAHAGQLVEALALHGFERAEAVALFSRRASPPTWGRSAAGWSGRATPCTSIV